MTKDKIIELLFNCLGYIYCHNCRFEDADDCDDCHRKSMGWQISKNCCEKIADKILEMEENND